MEMHSLLIPTNRRFHSFPVKTKHFIVDSPRKDSKIKLRRGRWSGTGSRQEVHHASLIQTLSRKGVPHLAHELLLEMKHEGFLSNSATLSTMMIYFANNGLVSQARAVWEEILHSSFVPSIQVISQLMDAYAKMGLFDEVTKVIDEIGSRNFGLLPEVYALAILSYGKQGQVEFMESTLKEMVSKGFPAKAATLNAFIRYYSVYGSLTEMELSYGRLKRSRNLIDKEGIRAMSSAYIRERKFYRLGEFLRDVGLRRNDVGNLVWNLLILSYAANFKMKSLQREFLRMLDAGFHPDLTTFNIRALAFSRISLFWDLHLSLEHMRNEHVFPDLVTFGCVVDAYLDRRLGRNLEFAFNRMNLDDSPVILTDPLVFEVLGKGDFHASSEAFLEFKRQTDWTYRKLVAIYFKKKFRQNQIFWNY